MIHGQESPGQRWSTPGVSLDDLARGGASGFGSANSQGSATPSSGAALPALLSDPKGVDFTLYLQHVKLSVEQVWRKIFPKNGKRGYVSVQFAIERDGTVGKVVFAQQTGDRVMDDTAIQAISAGGPFGPLPVQYNEGEIHVQMNFAYNPVHQSRWRRPALVPRLLEGRAGQGAGSGPGVRPTLITTYSGPTRLRPVPSA